MCKASKTIRFCSCEDNLVKATKHLKSIFYVWTLDRVVGFSDSGMDGLAMFPSEQLDELLPEFILKELNSKKLFDFDYIPQDNDSLQIKRVNPKKRYEKKELIGDHLNFYFEFGEWHIGYISPFTYNLKVYKNGKVEVL